ASGIEHVYADVIGGNGVVLRLHVARLKEENARCGEDLTRHARRVDIPGDEVVSNVSRRSPARLEAVLGNHGSWSYAKNPVVRYLSIRILVADRRPVFLVVVDHVADDSCRASSNVLDIWWKGHKASSHENRHAVLATTKGIVPDLCDVISKDVGGTSLVHTNAVAKAVASGATWARDRKGENCHIVSPVDPHDCFGIRHHRWRLDHCLPM